MDFNHSVYLLNDETPPLHVYLDDNAEQHSWQTQFELSDEDKLGIIKKIQSLTVDNKFSRPPVVSKEECDEVSQKWLETHPWHRIHSIQVVEYMTEIEKYSLDIDDLEDNMDKSNSL